jgi:hypothetical protein
MGKNAKRRKEAKLQEKLKRSGLGAGGCDHHGHCNHDHHHTHDLPPAKAAVSIPVTHETEKV